MTPEALAELHAACFTSPRPWSVGEFRGMLADPAVFLVAPPDGYLENGEEAGGIAGFALGRCVLDEAELLTVAVAPEARRKGLGRALLESFEDEARVRGATRGYLEVAADNAAALALYHGAGWVEAGRRRGYYARPGGAATDALVLTRVLDTG